METFISIIRGINVTGHRILKMDDLRKMYEGLQFKNVQTYIQSGNVIFQDYGTGQQELEKKISVEIKKSFGYDVTVWVLKADELKEIIARNPYRYDHTKDVSFMHVTFLASSPQSVNIELITSKAGEGESVTLDGKAVYLYLPNGYGRTKLNNTFLENILHVRATTRTWRTTLALYKVALNPKQ